MRILKWLVMSYFFFNVVYASQAVTDITVTTSDKSQVHLLFLQEAEQAEFTARDNQCYQLNLSNVMRVLRFFSESPIRTVGDMPTTEYLQLWQGNVTERNAALHGYSNIEKKSYSFIVTLSKPEYDQATDTMRYQACLTDNATEREIPAIELSKVILFIDPFDPNNWGGG
jgi:hypothetical protein